MTTDLTPVKLSWMMVLVTLSPKPLMTIMLAELLDKQDFTTAGLITKG